MEGRFRQLMPLCEDLAKRNDDEKNLVAHDLRDRIARVAWFSCRDGWDDELPLRKGHWHSFEELKSEVGRLWTGIRNPLSHTCRVIQKHSQDPWRDLRTMEILAASMIRALRSGLLRVQCNRRE